MLLLWSRCTSDNLLCVFRLISSFWMDWSQMVQIQTAQTDMDKLSCMRSGLFGSLQTFPRLLPSWTARWQQACVLPQICRLWSVDVMRFFLDRGADLLCSDQFGVTALHVASALDYQDMVQFLISQKGQCDQTYYKYKHPVPAAVTQGQKKKANWKNNLNLVVCIGPHSDSSASPVSHKLGLTKMMAYLIWVRSDQKKNFTSLGLCLPHPADKDARTLLDCQTPLHYASKNDAVGAIRLLLQAGASSSCTDYKNRTPLHLAANMGTSYVFTGITTPDP